MNVKESIMMRRSIRKYKSEDIPNELLYDLIDCARLAPSACNSQPWRFKIVKDKETKSLLSKMAFNQRHIEEAPVVIVCCAHIRDYIEGSVVGSEELYQSDFIEKNLYDIVQYRTKGLREKELELLEHEVSINTIIAIEHIVLRAVELGLGSCWIKMANDKLIRELFGWEENIRFVSLLTLGYPEVETKPIKKLSIQEILL